MGLYHNQNLKSQTSQDMWNVVMAHRFETMELYYRKQFSMGRVLSIFRKAFKIAPITLKNSKSDDKNYTKKLFALYLLTKYSKNSFEEIATEFHISVDDLTQISSKKFDIKDIKLFFKSFENEYLEDVRSSLYMTDLMKDLLDDFIQTL